MASNLDSAEEKDRPSFSHLNINWATLLVMLALIAGIGFMAFTLAPNLSGDPVRSVNGVASAESGSLDQQMIRIADRLQCPICGGQSVAFSGSQLAGEMRRIIMEQLEAGKDEDAIMRYFIDRYGISILREPPKNGLNLWLWVIPILAVVVAVVWLTWRLRQMSKDQGDRPTDPFLDTPEVQSLLAEYDKDLFT